jgi:nitroreductase
VRRRSIALAAKRAGTASAYYAVSGQFGREMQAVASGRARYVERGSGDLTDYLLRRNTHRLEKGLVSRPRRKVFATTYITETVDRFADAIAAHDGIIETDSELAWAHDVLSEYFGATGSDPVIDEARMRFDAVDARYRQLSAGDTHLIPYQRDLTPPPVDFDAFMALTIRRRSVRWFTDAPVPRSAIDAAITAAAQSPSACNRQPFEFMVYDRPEDVQRIATIPEGTAGFAENFPVVVAVVGKLDAFFSERDRHLIYIDGSLASMTFMLALETLGLSSCPINTPAVETTERRLAEELGLSAYERPVMLIAVGYPDPEGMVPRSQKKPLALIRRYPT